MIFKHNFLNPRQNTNSMFCFLDESGDLGFKEGSSRYFIITILKTNDEIIIKRILKRIRRRKLKKTLKNLPEFKGNNTTPEVRRAVLKSLNQHKIEIHSIVLDKSKVRSNIRDVKFTLYNYVAGSILPRALARNRTVNMVVDKVVNKKIIREDFNSYVKAQIQNRSFYPKVDIRVSHFDSKNSAGLQACDMICWSIFRKYESNDDSYYNLIFRKIKREKIISFSI